MNNELGKIRKFTDLDAWKEGHLFVMMVYSITKKFPKEEIFCLVSQMRRCAISITSNIAEGFNRYHNKEYKQFLYISLGSCAELETQVEVASDLRFINKVAKETLLEKLDHESRMIRNLIKKL